MIFYKLLWLTIWWCSH